MPPICQAGDQFSPAGESNPFGQGLPAHDLGDAGYAHQPVDLASSKCGGATRVIRLQQGQRTRVHLQPLDRNGALIQHPSIDTAAELSSSSGENIFDDFEFRLITDHYTGARRHVIDIAGEVIDHEFTVVEFLLTEVELRTAGMFVGHLLIHPAGNRDAILHATPYWVEVAATSFVSSNGPPTISEMRMLMRDECPEAEGLVGDYEFKDHEIAYYISRPVEQFNITRPPITRYTVATFPREYRFYWTKAVMGLLLRAAAQARARDSLTYDAGGISVSDKGNFDVYLKYANQLISEWEAFILERKAQLNVNRGWGSVRSDYGRGAVIH